MLVLLDTLFMILGACLLVPPVVLLIETAAALLPARRRAQVTGALPRFVVLVPAHDEAGQIEDTVRALLPELSPTGRLLVVADNCRDQTAALARSRGAEVLERHDPARLGKGFALSFGLDHLAAEHPPDVVIIFDADCRISSGGFTTLAQLAAGSGRPVQAEYLLGAADRPSSMAVMGALAILLRNRVRPRGLDRLGLPCPLTGSGMAFPWHVLRAAPAAGSNLVEDLVTGIELALLGYPARLCPDVRVDSTLPETDAAGLRQRRRWEHGQLQTLRTYVPRLLMAGLTRRSRALIGLGLDLAVPPLSLLVILLGGLLALTLVAALIGATSFLPVVAPALGLVFVLGAVGAAWAAFGRQTIRARHLLLAPVYLLWKIPLYLGLAVRGRQKKWERTARKGES